MIRTETLDGERVAITFSLAKNHPAMPVSAVGSFNNWQPYSNPLGCRPDGSASTTVEVPLGTTVYFRYLGYNGVWFDDVDALVGEVGDPNIIV